MFLFGINSLALWKVDYSQFQSELEEFARAKIGSFNCEFEFDIEKLKRIHTQWCVDCEDLLTSGFSTSKEELSDIKEMGLLVAIMASDANRFITLFSGDVSKDTPETILEREDFQKNRELVFAFDLAANVIDWHERNNPNQLAQTFSAFDILPGVRNDIFRAIESHPEDRKTITITLLTCLYRRT